MLVLVLVPVPVPMRIAAVANDFLRLPQGAGAEGSLESQLGVSAEVAVHGASAVLFFAAIALLEPSLKALASTARPAAEGGRSLGVLVSEPRDTLPFARKLAIRIQVLQSEPEVGL